MKSSFLKTGMALLLGLGALGAVHASIVTFTGGTVTLNDTTTQTTNNSVVWQDVAKYEEAGFRVEFIGATTPFTSIIGDYYVAGNDVIHGHWATGNFGGLTQIKFTKIDGTAFDLNYFVLTSNTDTGGSAASGNEQAFIHASYDGTTDDYSQLLPPDDWGFPASQIFLGTQFDNVKAFWFDVSNPVDCFGMDNFYINEAAPGTVPEPGTLALLGLGILGAAVARRRKL